MAANYTTHGFYECGTKIMNNWKRIVFSNAVLKNDQVFSNMRIYVSI